MQTLYVDHDAEALFQELKRKYGSHQGAAAAIKLPRRTYADWRMRGLSTPEKWDRVRRILRSALSDGHDLSVKS